MSESRELNLLERAVDRALLELGNHPVGSNDYDKALDHVVKLHRMREEEKSQSISKDTLVVAIANIIGIILIIRHEDVNVITSRAMNLLLKPRA